MRPDPRPLEDRVPIRIDRDNFQKVMAEQRLGLYFPVRNRLSEEEGAELNVSLRFRRMSDLEPDSIASQVPELKELLDRRAELATNGDPLLNEIDVMLSRQMDEIIHHPTFKTLESCWRGLKFVVDRTDFRENIKIEFLNCPKEDLVTDFENSPDVTLSGLYKIVYSAAFGQRGVQPFGAIISSYELGADPQDIALLQKCASVAATAQAPFLAAAGPQLFGLQDYLSLPGIEDLRALFQAPQYAELNAFRESENSRYVSLMLPRFLLRLPFGSSTVPISRFVYEEDVSGGHEAYSWGNATYAFATRIAESFALYRWCSNIIGPQGGGTVAGLPRHQYEAMGALHGVGPVEVPLTEGRELELSEKGFISFAARESSGDACFYSANSLRRPKSFGESEEGRVAAIHDRLGTQLPYQFVIYRFAHYLMALTRENISSWKERSDRENELNNWLQEHKADMDVISSADRARRPLRQAKIFVSGNEGNNDYFRFDLQLRPRFQYNGAFFTLSVHGRLDLE